MSAPTREEKQRSAALTAALESLRALTATEYARHLELGSTKAHLMTAEQAAEYDAVYDRIALLVDAWVSEEIDDWHQMVLTLLMDRDEARMERDRLSLALREAARIATGCARTDGSCGCIDAKVKSWLAEVSR